MAKFGRKLSPQCISALEALARCPASNWWKEVLASPDLFLAVRDGYLNAYVNGQSVFKIGSETGNGLEHGAPKIRIHYKYLLKPDLGKRDPYIRFDGQSFAVKPGDIIQTAYKADLTLPQLIKAASRFSGAEKIGVNEIARKEPKIIDLEIAFSRLDEEGSSAPRMDLAVLIPQGKTGASLVFCEAKCANNVELWTSKKQDKSDSRAISVVTQIEKYQTFISSEKNKENLIEAYINVCNILIALGDQGRTKRPDRLIKQVADREVALTIHPHVYLLIYDFTDERRKGALGGQIKALSNRLGTRIIAKGKASDISLASDIERIESRISRNA